MLSRKQSTLIIVLNEVATTMYIYNYSTEVH